jgi:diguanylate cyclase (GGDEF)-like protein
VGTRSWRPGACPCGTDLSGANSFGDAAGRLGGDEFLLFLKDASIAEAEAICGRIRATLRQTAIAMDTKTDIMLSLSCGIAGSSHAGTFQDIYRDADKALYMAKFAGRNTVRSIA